MGSCSLTKSDKIKSIIPAIQLQYSRQALIKISNRHQNTKNTEFTEVAFHLSEPIKIFSDSIYINNNTFQLSYSVIPGLDPRNDQEKQCQDNCFAISNEDCVFLGLYDGHGANGDKVSSFCSELAQNLFSVFTSFPDPIEFLQYVTNKCEAELEKSQIDAKLSGSTQVLILYANSKIYCATLGDSRAILATSNPPDLVPAPYNGPFHMNPVLVEVKQRRNSILNKYITPVQLTFDQKPDLPEELYRITQCGGRVDQMKNSSGQGIGPFRVWEMNTNSPGLAVSRALGDFTCKKLGISAEPICSTHSVVENDYFIVIASDGIWDVMDNEDVTNFIESYRIICKRKTRSSVLGHLVNPSNSCIAQMLCEEARVRWFSIVREEDVSIDDISCIVLELKETPLKVTMKLRSQTKSTESAQDEMENNKIEGPYHRDPRRGSLMIPTTVTPVLI
ncbi:hypothetical protein SteCoe_4632 [Stentor coeruleus]|uniref:PPM-type phosphatase domain-containing protein n=1 Tax=Stentor coeruleus TaxID=5963 RepID=A0A1R2CUF7_9CILI|nr:hypothetical protein SteCoe_4632 [Stentor coeruleus]